MYLRRARLIDLRAGNLAFLVALAMIAIFVVLCVTSYEAGFQHGREDRAAQPLRTIP